MNNHLRRATVLVLGAITLPAMAQFTADSLTNEQTYRLHSLTDIWQNTNNPSGLSIDASPNRGNLTVTYSHRGGDYHRVQEGGMNNDLSFSTERYQRIGKYLYSYGRVNFSLGRTKDRAFADQYRPYNGNPFLSGSAIQGSYDNQDFDIKAAIGTVDFSGWRFGLQLNYQLGDLSRLRDPRSRAQLLDYRLTPAVSYSFGKNTIGLAGYYDRRKEKMGSLQVVQTDATLRYYLFSGLENNTSTVNGYSGFNREWVNHQFGTELNYGYQTSAFQTLNGFGLSRGEEYVYGTYKFEPGRYVDYHYQIQSQNRVRTGRTIHQLDLNAQWQQGYANEYRQNLVIENDPQNGVTSYHYDQLLEFKKRFQVRTFDFDFRYRANFTDNVADLIGTEKTKSAITAYSGLALNFQSAKNRHLLPFSESNYGRLNLQLEDGISLFRRRVQADVVLGYSVSTRARLNLADPTNIIAQEVLYKDLPYYDANLFHGSLQVMYQFPLTIKKSRSLWYVKAFGDFTSANTVGHPNTYTFGMSIGLFN